MGPVRTRALARLAFRERAAVVDGPYFFISPVSPRAVARTTTLIYASEPSQSRNAEVNLEHSRSSLVSFAVDNWLVVLAAAAEPRIDLSKLA